VISLRNNKRATRQRSQSPGRQPGPRSGSRRHPRANARSASVLRRDFAIVAVIGAILMMVHVFEYASVARMGYERAHLRADERRISRENSNLRAEREILERPQRIDELASSRKMVQRNDADFIALAPVADQPAAQARPMLAGFLPEWMTNLVNGKR
jgi:hypothetical protein